MVNHYGRIAAIIIDYHAAHRPLPMRGLDNGWRPNFLFSLEFCGGTLVMNRLELFKTALDACVQLQGNYPEGYGLASIIKQLQYLISLETGQNSDRGRLKDIVLGVQAAREIEPLDMKVAELLHAVDAEARRM